jgi:hypothetical protein
MMNSKYPMRTTEQATCQRAKHLTASNMNKNLKLEKI